MKITKHFSFEASHVLPLHPGKCSRLHGHSWKLAVEIEGSVNPVTGFVLDYGILSKVVKANLIDQLDHTHLGAGTATCFNSEWPTGKDFYQYFKNIYPSSENLCRACFKLLSPLIQEIKDVRLYSIKIAETCTSEAIWTAEDEYGDGGGTRPAVS
jgi:6-pyruvoyl tetrahydropterin synthase/QueD family protein